MWREKKPFHFRPDGGRTTRSAVRRKRRGRKAAARRRTKEREGEGERPWKEERVRLAAVARKKKCRPPRRSTRCCSIAGPRGSWHSGRCGGWELAVRGVWGWGARKEDDADSHSHGLCTAAPTHAGPRRRPMAPPTRRLAPPTPWRSLPARATRTSPTPRPSRCTYAERPAGVPASSPAPSRIACSCSAVVARVRRFSACRTGCLMAWSCRTPSRSSRGPRWSLSRPRRRVRRTSAHAGTSPAPPRPHGPRQRAASCGGEGPLPSPAALLAGLKAAAGSSGLAIEVIERQKTDALAGKLDEALAAAARGSTGALVRSRPRCAPRARPRGRMLMPSVRWWCLGAFGVLRRRLQRLPWGYSPRS